MSDADSNHESTSVTLRQTTEHDSKHRVSLACCPNSTFSTFTYCLFPLALPGHVRTVSCSLWCFQQASTCVLQRQFMSLVGQYDMGLFTTIFSLLFVPVPGFTLGAFDCLQVRNPFLPSFAGLQKPSPLGSLAVDLISHSSTIEYEVVLL